MGVKGKIKHYPLVDVVRFSHHLYAQKLRSYSKEEKKIRSHLRVKKSKVSFFNLNFQPKFS